MKTLVQDKQTILTTKHFKCDEFYILALSLKKIKLFKCAHYRNNEYEINELKLDDNLLSFSKVMGYDRIEKQLQAHTSTGQASKSSKQIYHGHGVGKDHHKDNIFHFFRKLDKYVHRFLSNKKSPLILVGVDYLIPIYKKANTYKHLLAEGVIGSPDRFSKTDLYKKSWRILKGQVCRPVP